MRILRVQQFIIQPNIISRLSHAPGPLGQALFSATDLPVRRFPRLSLGPGLSELSEDVRQDLSSIQRYGYDMVTAVRNGGLSDHRAGLDIGPVNHSRWLTTANRFLRLWLSQHGFKGLEAMNPRMTCKHTVGVYYPTWFQYTISNNWMQGAQICLQQLKLTLEGATLSEVQRVVGSR